MKRRLLAPVLLCTLALSGCTAENQVYYERAQLFLGGGDYASAAELFGALGGYGDSCDYLLYASGLKALAEGDLTLARTDLTLVADFLDAPLCLRYLDALEAEARGDSDAALQGFTALGSFRDAAEKAQALREDIPAKALREVRLLMDRGDYATALLHLAELSDHPDAPQLMAECEDGLDRQAYARAVALYDAGDWQGALDAFTAMPEVEDSRARALSCQSELYRAAVRAEGEVTLADAATVMTQFEALGGYLDSAAHLTALHVRWDTALRLAHSAEEVPYVVLGQWPGTVAGEPLPLTWRVLNVSDNTATLLCQRVLDTGDYAAAAAFAPQWTDAERAAVAALSLPELSQLSAHPALCAAQGTPYALAQGVRSDAAGHAWYWLTDESGAGRRSAIHYTGLVLPHGLPEELAEVGVRPVVTLRLTTGLLTQGTGSAEDPFR